MKNTLGNAKSRRKMFVLVLHNIRSVHNVGSMFRTADAAGVSHIVLSGYTPGPTDHFGRERKDFCKVSLGAERAVPYSRAAQLTPALRKLKKEGFVIAAIEQSPESVSLFDWRSPAQPLAIVMGNEVRGISKQSLTHADTVLEIPMNGKKESLNVSVACGIALFALTR